MARHESLMSLSKAETVTVGAFRFWKWCRMTRQPTVPGLYRRLVAPGGAMLAVSFDAFFRLIAAPCVCTCDTTEAKVNVLAEDEAAVLELLHAAAVPPKHHEIQTERCSASVVLLAAWAVRRQLASELGLAFGSRASKGHMNAIPA